ncbi:MAG: hypothetical protein Q9162_006477 [Coniocarpon cinnabarinum]
MAKPTPRDRILSHMNADHADSLVVYLQYYHGLSSFSARKARLTDISPVRMEIRISPNAIYRIPFDPPLADWSETRGRVVAMDQEARTSLGISNITVKKYVRPDKAWQWTILFAVAFTFMLLGRGREALSPTTGGITAPLKDRFPGAFAWLYKIQPLVLYPTLAIHLAEAVIMDQTRLAKHNVPRGGRLWWTWVLMTFLGGFPNFWRFDALIDAEQKARDSKQH